MEFKIEQTEDGKRFQQSLDKLSGKVSSQAGWFDNNRYPDKNKTPVAYIASIQEHGVAGKIPPRPFIGPAIRENQAKWLYFVEYQSKQLLRNQTTLEEIFGRLANDGKDQIQLKIREVSSPPLAEATILARLYRRKSKVRTASIEKPLIDTGHMFNTVSYRVNNE